MIVKLSVLLSFIYLLKGVTSFRGCQQYAETHKNIQPDPEGISGDVKPVRQRMGDISYRFCHIYCQQNRGISNCEAFSWGKPKFMGECWLYSEIDESKIPPEGSGKHKLYQCTQPGGATQLSPTTAPPPADTDPTPPTATDPSTPEITPVPPTSPPVTDTVPPDTQPPATQPSPTTSQSFPEQTTPPVTQPDTLPPETSPITQSSPTPSQSVSEVTTPSAAESTTWATDPPVTTESIPTTAEVQPDQQPASTEEPTTQATTTSSTENACGTLGLSTNGGLEMFSEEDSCVVLHSQTEVQINVAAKQCTAAPKGHLAVNVTTERTTKWRQANAFPSLNLAHIALIQINKQNEPAGNWYYVQPDGTYWMADADTAWQANQPDNNQGTEDCAVLMPDYTIGDVPCNTKSGYLCQYPVLKEPEVECKFVWTYKNLLPNAAGMADESYHLSHLPIMDVQVCANYCSKNYGLTRGACEAFSYGISQGLNENECWLYHKFHTNNMKAGNDNLYVKHCTVITTVPPQTTVPQTTEPTTTAQVTTQSVVTTELPPPTSPVPETTMKTKPPETTMGTAPPTTETASSTISQEADPDGTGQEEETTTAPTVPSKSLEEGCKFSKTIYNIDPRPAGTNPEFHIAIKSKNCTLSCMNYAGPFKCKAFSTKGSGKHCYIYGEMSLVSRVAGSGYHLNELICNNVIPPHKICEWFRRVTNADPSLIEPQRKVEHAHMSQENCQKYCHYQAGLQCNAYIFLVANGQNFGHCTLLEISDLVPTKVTSDVGKHHLYTQVCSG